MSLWTRCLWHHWVYPDGGRFERRDERTVVLPNGLVERTWYVALEQVCVRCAARRMRDGGLRIAYGLPEEGGAS